MIRNKAEDTSSRAGFTLIVIALSAIILLCVGIGFAYSATLQGSGFVLLAGTVFVAALGLLSAIHLRRNNHIFNRRQASRDSIYSDAFFSGANPAVIIRNGRPVHANAAYTQLAQFLDVSLGAQSAPSIERMFNNAGREAAASIFRLHHMNSSSRTSEEIIDLIAPDDTLRRYCIHVTQLPDRPLDVLWEIIDITLMGGAHEDLLSDAPIGLFAVDKTGKILTTNSVLNRWLGGENAVMPGHIKEFIENPQALLESFAEDGRTVRTDARLITRKGVVTPTLMVGIWKKLNTGEMTASVALYGHSTFISAAPAKRSSTAAPKQAGFKDGAGQKLPHLESLEVAPVAILQMHGKTVGTAKIQSANAAFERMSGQSDWEAKPLARVFADVQDQHRFLKLAPSECLADRPYDATLAGASNLAVSTYIVADVKAAETASAGRNVADIGPSLDEGPALDMDTFWVYLVDISARKSLEDQLIQSQKMQAIGQLAAGVAHDFNNLLTAIRLNTDELLQRHPVGDPSYPELQNINMTGARAAALVKKLLAFSRKQTRRMERINVTETLSDMVMTLKQTLGERAKLTMVHERGLPLVVADKSQIDTVLMNLCVNARDAMDAQGGGDIEVRTSLMPRSKIEDEALSEALRGIAGDDFVIISVKDTGTGMSDDIKAKIFEPFFTTKDLGKGTGLGLATVYGIVQQTGGHLDVQSQIGVGTTFRIFLPAADMDGYVAEVAAPAKAAPAARKPSDLAGQGNILFVEDEASVRDIAAKSLRKRGYKVVEAEDGEEALEILEDTKVTFDLMISDVVMPGLGGPELLKQGRDMLGNARIVFISGYAEEEFSELLSEEPDVTFLPKPFTLAQLAEKVKMEIGDADL